MGFTSKLHNMESLDDIIEDVNKNIKKVFLAGVAPEFWQEAYIIGLKLTLDRLAQELEFAQKDDCSSKPASSEQWSAETNLYSQNSYPIFKRKYLEIQRLDSYNLFSLICPKLRALKQGQDHANLISGSQVIWI